MYGLYLWIGVPESEDWKQFLFQVLSLIKVIDKRLHVSFLISFKDTEL